MSFIQRYTEASAAAGSMVCVGLDPVPEKFPHDLRGRPDSLHRFLKDIVDATADLVCAYKPNFAFFGALGTEGLDALARVIRERPAHVPVILDFKAGDIGNTARHYAAMAYDVLGADATTVNPLMGADAVEPFLTHAGRCAFLLCLTSNPGASDFQRLTILDGDHKGPLYEAIARKSVAWSSLGECGLVVGATHPSELAAIRAIAPGLPILVPGVGAQGGDASSVVAAGADARGRGLLINASRSILYASPGSDYADAARRQTEALRSRLESARPAF